MPDYTVKPGDCISSISFEYGLFWKKVWDHPRNAGLREKRKDPYVLYEGDVVFVPEEEEKQEGCATEQKHRFRRKGVPEKFHVTLMAGKDPIPPDLRIAHSPAQAITDADVICTATTSTTPVFSDKDLKPGAHINAVCAYTPHMQEIPPETVRRALLIVDSHSACLSEAGDAGRCLTRSDV